MMDDDFVVAILVAVICLATVLVVVLLLQMSSIKVQIPTEQDHQYLATEIFKNRQELWVIQTKIAPKQ